MCDIADQSDFLPAAKEEFIRDELVFGLPMAALRGKLISSEKTELLSVIASIRPSALDKPSENIARKCQFCDRQHPSFERMCPARDQRS